MALKQKNKRGKGNKIQNIEKQKSEVVSSKHLKSPLKGSKLKRKLYNDKMRDREKNYKPVPCKYFLAGSCKHDDCTFSHDVTADQMKRFNEPCKYYANGECAKGSMCCFMHQDFPCQFFHDARGSMCRRAACKFSHAPLTVDMSEALRKFLEKDTNRGVPISVENPQLIKPIQSDFGSILFQSDILGDLEQTSLPKNTNMEGPIITLSNLFNTISDLHGVDKEKDNDEEYQTGHITVGERCTSNMFDFSTVVVMNDDNEDTKRIHDDKDTRVPENDVVVDIRNVPSFIRMDDDSEDEFQICVRDNVDNGLDKERHTTVISDENVRDGCVLESVVSGHNIDEDENDECSERIEIDVSSASDTSGGPGDTGIDGDRGRDSEGELNIDLGYPMRGGSAACLVKKEAVVIGVVPLQAKRRRRKRSASCSSQTAVSNNRRRCTGPTTVKVPSLQTLFQTPSSKAELDTFDIDIDFNLEEVAPLFELDSPMAVVVDDRAIHRLYIDEPRAVAPRSTHPQSPPTQSPPQSPPPQSPPTQSTPTQSPPTQSTPTQSPPTQSTPTQSTPTQSPPPLDLAEPQYSLMRLADCPTVRYLDMHIQCYRLAHKFRDPRICNHPQALKTDWQRWFF